MNFSAFRQLDELSITAHITDGQTHHYATARVSPHVSSLADAIWAGLEHATLAVLDHRDKARLGIESGEGSHEPILKRHRALSFEEAEDMEQLICLFMSGYVSPRPLKHGRMLEYIKRVDCVNPNDWSRPPLYIPNPFGVGMYEREVMDKCRVMDQKLIAFANDWRQHHQTTLARYREQYAIPAKLSSA